MLAFFDRGYGPKCFLRHYFDEDLRTEQQLDFGSCWKPKSAVTVWKYASQTSRSWHLSAAVGAGDGANRSDREPTTSSSSVPSHTDVAALK